MRARTTVAIVALATATLGAQSVSQNQRASAVHQALERLPYYGVFDFLAYSVDRGTVTLAGYAYRGNLKEDAERAVKRVPGVDGVENTIEILPASQGDDRIRWATFYNIYADDFLSRYAPGGAMAARYEVLTFARFPGHQPFGTYPIHIIVKNGRTKLIGVVDRDADKTVAALKARQIGGVFEVENEIQVEKK
ncbi:MAG TPA: BON domain-containing protein [Vicinamibacterales bacterium]|nr:BON domain-containing protein [Vicinamibacterales bacterium]